MGRDAQASAAEASFPFQDLPIELQIMVLRMAMPTNGVVPASSGRYDHWEPSHNRIPVALLSVNKAFSSLARSIIENEVFVNFEMSPDNGAYPSMIKVLGRLLLGVPPFRSNVSLKDTQHLKNLCNFELTIGADHVSPWGFIRDRNHSDPSFPWDLQCYIYKEQMRLVCDTLAFSTKAIRHLRVRFPCLCSPWSVPTTNDALALERKMIDFLAPLRRLRVAEPVTFEIDHNEWNCDYNNPKPEWMFGRLDPYDQVRTQHLQHSLETSFGKLIGEKLS